MPLSLARIRLSTRSFYAGIAVQPNAAFSHSGVAIIAEFVAPAGAIDLRSTRLGSVRQCAAFEGSLCARVARKKRFTTLHLRGLTVCSCVWLALSFDACSVSHHDGHHS